MSIETDIYTYLSAQWGTRTKIVFPNTNSSQYSGAYSDADSIIYPFVVFVDSDTLEIPVVPSSTRAVHMLLSVNVAVRRDRGDGILFGHVEVLTNLFHNQTIEINGTQYYFADEYKRGTIMDDSFYILPWGCDFKRYG